MDPYRRNIQKHRERVTAQKQAKKDKVARVQTIHASNKEKGNMDNSNIPGWVLNDKEELVRA